MNHKLECYQDYLDLFSSINTTELWDLFLGTQAEIMQVADLAFMSNCEIFMKANKVLELGCGPGKFLKVLAGNYPDKEYVGVDISDEYIRRSTEHLNTYENIQLICDDIYKFNRGQYDLVLLKFVVQHLPNNKKLLRHLKSLLSTNGAILIIDAHDSSSCLSHKVPEFAKISKSLSKGYSKRKSSRDAISKIENICRKYGYAIESSYCTSASIITDCERKLYLKGMMLGGEVYVRRYGINLDHEKFYDQLTAWFHAEESYAKLGLKYLVLTPELQYTYLPYLLSQANKASHRVTSWWKLAKG